MFIKKVLLALPLIPLLASNVQAEEQTKSMNAGNEMTQKANTKKTEVNKKNATTNTTKKASSSKTSQVPGLDSFNKNVTIKLVQRGNDIKNNQPVAIFVYEVTNKGRNKIKSLHWTSAFTVNEQIFLLQEDIIPVFEKALQPKQKETVTLTLLLDKIPDNARKLLASLETPIGHITIAKQIDFTNGKKIIVKE